jgi:hypothetical protein
MRLLRCIQVYILYRIDNQELKIILCVCLIVRS